MVLPRLVSFLAVAAVTAGYYVVPVGHRDEPTWAFPLAFGAGTAALAVLLFSFVERAQTVRGRVNQLVALAYLTIVFFAHAYFVVESTSPGQFDGLTTRTDALYLSVTVVTTVGFGDVHAAGQLARGLVIVQMLFNVFVLGVAVTAVRSLPHPTK